MADTVTTERRERSMGALVAALGIAVNVAVMGPATTLLSLALVAAYYLWVAARWSPVGPRLLPLYLLGITVQCVHFYEEYQSGFQREFPGLLGYQWTDARFVTFNLLWLATFVVAAFGLSRNSRLAYLIVFFFALGGGVGNGLGHLMLSVVQRRYFPGLLTAPLCLLIGVALLVRLLWPPHPDGDGIA